MIRFEQFVCIQFTDLEKFQELAILLENVEESDVMNLHVILSVKL